MRNLKALKETKKSYIVDVDDYYNRERYYTGTRAGQVLRIEKAQFPKLLEAYNDYYDTELDALLDMLEDRESIKGVHIHRKGWIVK
jgi:hypothetical protein